MKDKRRELKPGEQNAFWYVDLPADRKVRRTIVSEEEWMGIVRGLVSKNERGEFVCRGVDGDVKVGSPEWKAMLRHWIVSERCQMFWEPKRAKRNKTISQDENGHPIINTLFGVLRGGTPEYTAFLEEQRQARFLRSRRRK